jgi:hypothetical protein
VSPVVYLHIGAPKTGTTYLQDRLSLNAKSLARHDVHFPTRSPLVSPALFQFRAALDLLGQDWGGEPGHAHGNWDALVRRVRRRSGTVIISHEILAPARRDQVAKVMADLADCEVHVVYSTRDLGRALPAAWQESIKQGRTWRFRRFLDRCEHGKPWFIRAFDLPTVLGTWGAGLPPERLHVVTVPQRRDEAPDGLWLRFCQAFGIDPAWAPADSDRANPSMGVAETAVIRALNHQLGRGTRREAPYDSLIREMLAENALVDVAGSDRVQLPPTAYGWVEERAQRSIDYLQQSGVDVIGGLDDLRPVWLADDGGWVDPDRVRPRLRFRVAVQALAAMTAEAASRPDPDQQLVRRMRANAERLRGR